MVAGWDKATLERVINYRIGFPEPLLISVLFSFLPFVTVDGFETIGGGHACCGRAERGWTFLFLASRRLYIKPSRLQHQTVIYKESWVSICFPALRECLLHSIENYLRPCWVFPGKIYTTVWVTYMPPWLGVPLHRWGPILRNRVNVIVDIPWQRNGTAISFFFFSSFCARLLCYQLTISYKALC